jgi:hypothetical protein
MAMLDSWKTPCYPTGVIPESDGRGGVSEMLPVREVAMMLVMDRLTDKPNWHEKVFNKEITDRWIAEGLAMPNDELWNEITDDVHPFGRSKPLPGILSKAALQFVGYTGQPRPSHLVSPPLTTLVQCIAELQAKARHFKEMGVIPTLDADASMAKSHTIVDSSLHRAVEDAFAKLKADQADDPDWHPGSGEMVQDLVHPSLYPLVYGQTRVFKQECVGVTGALKWAGTGEIIPRPPPFVKGESENWYEIDHISDYWTDKYQWLPANVAFQDNGRVRFTSYINNLHPERYPDIYATIEELIDRVLPLWDHCLVPKRNLPSGYHQPRQSRFPRPDNPWYES